MPPPTRPRPPCRRTWRATGPWSTRKLQPSVASLAAELGISATQLNRLCRAQLGRGALELLHERMALEAQRQLAYTTLSVKRIGLELGFADPGYFTRFFQRLCGMSPTAWREQAHSA